MTTLTPTEPFEAVEDGTALTPAGMLAAVESCRPLAIGLAKRFHETNPTVRLRDLVECAFFALKLAAVNFDPSRGHKFVTPAHVYVTRELINFCRVESARGMHVPGNHDPYYAPRPGNFDEEWRHPPAPEEPHDFGPDFWAFVTRTLDARDAAVLLRVYRDGMNRKEVGAEIGLTKTRVGQLVRRAENKLRGRADLRELAGVVGVAPRRKGRPRTRRRAA